MSRLRRLVVSMAVVGVMAIAGWWAASYAPLQAMTSAGQLDPRAASAVPPVTVSRPRAAQSAAGAQAPRTQIKASYADYPIEALEKGVSGTVTVNITINSAGEVSTAAVTDGPQALRASAFKAAMGLKYTPGPSTTAATIYVEYRLDRQGWGVQIAESRSAGRTIFVQAPRPLPGRSPALGATQEPGPELRVGGEIRPPKKIKDMPPVYPQEALDANVQGVVILEVRIDTAGRVSDTKVLRSIPMLDQAAIDAVKQWEYEPTLLNGQAIPVVMTVTVNFTKRDTLRDFVALNITTPYGQAQALEVETPGELGVVTIPAAVVSGSVSDDRLIKFAFAAAVPTGSPGVIKVTVFQFLDNERMAWRVLGTVDVTIGGGMVKSATSPSFGIEAVRWERR